MSELRYDWHDSQCEGGEWVVVVGEAPVVEPCSCEMPRLFQAAHQDGRDAARAALSAAAIREALVVLPPPKNLRAYAKEVRARLLTLLDDPPDIGQARKVANR